MSEIYQNKGVNQRILSLLEAKGKMSRYKLSQVINVSQASISDNINEKSKWGVESLIKIAKYFNVTIDWLITGKDSNADGMKLLSENDNGLEVPIYGMAICGMPVSDWSEPKDYISVGFAKGLNNAFAVKASGFSMSQTIIPGDIVFAYKSNVKPKNGSIVLASMKTVPDAKEGLIKRIKWLPKKQIMLYSDNSRNNEPMVVDESDVYEIFTVHSQIIRQLK